MMKPNDIPREELMRRAEQCLVEFGDLAEVHFKFTCEHCGERCTLTEPNKLYEKGECNSCGKETTITRGGFMLQMILDLKPTRKKIKCQ